MTEHRLGIANSGSLVRVGLGDTIVIELDENPTTGYSWEIQRVDAGVLSDPESEFEFESAHGATGAGGRRRFVCHLIGAGRAEPMLVLRRPWEHPEAAVQRWEAVVEAAAQ